MHELLTTSLAAIVPVLLLGAALHSAAGAAEQASGSVIAQRFRGLTRGSAWKQVGAVPLSFDTGHPQGMTRVGDRFFLSSVSLLSRLTGKGRGHIFEFDRKGNLLRKGRLGEGAMYHPGGIDYDGEAIWISVAEYRPDSNSVVYRVNPDTLEAQRLFVFPDHLGAITHDAATGTLFAVSWGSRRFYTWKTSVKDGRRVVNDPQNPVRRMNPSHYVDYQDLQGLPGTSYVLCSGLSGYRLPDVPGQGAEAGPTLDILAPGFALGGIEMVDVQTGQPVHQVPITLWTEKGRVMTQNPFLVEAGDKGLRAYFIPEDNKSTMYIYETGE